MYKITDTTCPKCGGEVHGATFIHGGDMEIDSERTRHSGQLKRTCGQCGYFWYINSLDNNEKA